MNAKFRLTNPDAMEAAMTFTMTVGEWKKLREQLDSSRWPVCDFRRLVGAVVRDAEQTFHEHEKDAQ